jgi:HAD superfamily hydrolase (TIGR01490 family)
MSIAFFDIDGTLLPNPSLELRFFWDLFHRGKIPRANCFRWAVRMLRLAATDPSAAVLANKMYLRGLSANIFRELGDRREPFLPEFFPAAIQRVWWHALRGDAIVLVSGTLAPLAEMVKAALERELLWRGVERNIPVLATRIELDGGCSTGQVDGAPMFGRAKASAVVDFASEQGIALEQCSAYGDHALDCSMLAAVGNAFAVNPSAELCRAARLRGWRVVRWQACAPRTARQALRWKGQTAP